MQCFAGVMVWLSMFALIALNAFGLYYCINRYKTMSNESEEIEKEDVEVYNFRELLQSHLNSYLANRNTWLVFSVICGVILTILLLLLFSLRSRIRIAIALIEEASK